MIIGLDFYGVHHFRSPACAIQNIYYGEVKNVVVDELEIRSNTGNIDLSSAKTTEWSIDHVAIFKFLNDLEGGNITNNGLQIVKFDVKRRKASELDSYTLDSFDFVNNTQVEYIDYTQPNDDLIYSITPVAENEISGSSAEVSVSSDFTGWWVVDKDTKQVIGFDTAIGSLGDVETSLNQGRTVINTLSKYPTVFYSPSEYHTFSLTGAFIPEESQRSGTEYEQIITNFVRNHKPFLVKSSNGTIYICDISNPRSSTPMNTWRSFDYQTLTLDFIEVGSVDEYMRGEI